MMPWMASFYDGSRVQNRAGPSGLESNDSSWCDAMLAMPSAFLVKESSAEIFARAANSYHAACTRRVSADPGTARVEVVTQIQSGSSRTDCRPTTRCDYRQDTNLRLVVISGNNE